MAKAAKLSLFDRGIVARAVRDSFSNSIPGRCCGTR